VHLADSAKTEDDSNKYNSGKLKNLSVEMPNAPYSKRYLQAEKPTAQTTHLVFFDTRANA